MTFLSQRGQEQTLWRTCRILASRDRLWMLPIPFRKGWPARAELWPALCLASFPGPEKDAA